MNMNVSNHTVQTVKEIGKSDICYMKPLSNELPRSDNVLFVFYDFETTEDTKISDSATVHVPNLVSSAILFALRNTARF